MRQTPPQTPPQRQGRRPVASPPVPRQPQTPAERRQARHEAKEAAKNAALQAQLRREDAQFVRVYTGIDRPFLVLVLALLAFGIIMGFSAGYSYASYEHGDALYFFKRNLLFAGLGIVAMFLCLYIPLEGMRMLVFPGYGVAIVLLLLVFVPGIGRAEGDALRWIYVPGIGTFQPSELAKLAVVMMMAWYLSTFQNKITSRRREDHPFLWGFVGGCAVFGIIDALVAAEHHISGTIIIALIGVIMMFIGRVKVRYLVAAGALMAAAVVVLVLVSGYGMTRIEVWYKVLFAPETISKEMARNEAYQNLQGLYAIGSGGIFGQGLGNSFQKYGFVSQPQNDFIFSIICEELGFIGAMGVVGLFAALGWRGYVIASRAPDLFSSLIVAGITTQVTLQAILNMLVVTAVAPNTGISLPFFSSGGTSLVILMLEMGIVLSISRYSYQKRT